MCAEESTLVIECVSIACIKLHLSTTMYMYDPCTNSTEVTKSQLVGFLHIDPVQWTGMPNEREVLVNTLLKHWYCMSLVSLVEVHPLLWQVCPRLMLSMITSCTSVSIASLLQLEYFSDIPRMSSWTLHIQLHMMAAAFVHYWTPHTQLG